MLQTYLGIKDDVTAVSILLRSMETTLQQWYVDPLRPFLQVVCPDLVFFKAFSLTSWGNLHLLSMLELHL